MPPGAASPTLPRRRSAARRLAWHSHSLPLLRILGHSLLLGPLRNNPRLTKQHRPPSSSSPLQGVTDAHPRVRWASCQALGQLCTDLGPDLQARAAHAAVPQPPAPAASCALPAAQAAGCSGCRLPSPDCSQKPCRGLPALLAGGAARSHPACGGELDGGLWEPASAGPRLRRRRQLCGWVLCACGWQRPVVCSTASRSPLSLGLLRAWAQRGTVFPAAGNQEGGYGRRLGRHVRRRFLPARADRYQF